MLVLVVSGLFVMALAAVGSVCDRWGPPDPTYPRLHPAELSPARCPGPSSGSSRRRSTAA